MSAAKSSSNKYKPQLPKWLSDSTRRPVAAVAAAVVAILGAYFVVTSLAATGIGTLTLSPSSSTVALGSTFTVTVSENSSTTATKTVQANMTYSSNLQFVSVDYSTSAFGTQAQSTTGNGVVQIARASTTDLTGSQILGVITFKAISAGTGTVNFDPIAVGTGSGNAIVSSTGNTNILGTQVNASYSITDQTAPAIPGGLAVASHAVTSIGLSWTASTDNVGVTGYKVYRNGTQVATTTGTTYTNTGLTPNTTYTYTVAAYDAAGNVSAQSPGVTGTTDPDTTAPTVPGTPTQSSRTMTTMAISWTASTDNVGVTGYKVYRNGTQVATTTTTNYSDTDLVPGTTYTYKVAAFDAAGNTSAQSTGASLATAPDTQAPTVPGSLTATSTTSTSVSLSWTASTDNVGVTGYKIYRNSSTTALATVTTTSYTNSGLTGSTAYTYQVSAIDAAGNESAKSSVISTTTPASGDLNGDGHINIFDLSLFLNHWQETGTGLPEDFNGDNLVNIFDLSILLNNYGT
jgi:chitodextrinase